MTKINSLCASILFCCNNSDHTRQHAQEACLMPDYGATIESIPFHSQRVSECRINLTYKGPMKFFHTYQGFRIFTLPLCGKLIAVEFMID